jgi:hypothetical protein
VLAEAASQVGYDERVDAGLLRSVRAVGDGAVRSRRPVGPPTFDAPSHAILEILDSEDSRDHVLAGDILSANPTERVAAAIVEFVRPAGTSANITPTAGGPPSR